MGANNNLPKMLTIVCQTIIKVKEISQEDFSKILPEKFIAANCSENWHFFKFKFYYKLENFLVYFFLLLVFFLYTVTLMCFSLNLAMLSVSSKIF